MMRVGKTVNLGYKRLYAILPVYKYFLETLIQCNPFRQVSKIDVRAATTNKNPFTTK